jgi:hypothetical protein
MWSVTLEKFTLSPIPYCKQVGKCIVTKILISKKNIKTPVPLMAGESSF